MAYDTGIEIMVHKRKIEGPVQWVINDKGPHSLAWVNRGAKPVQLISVGRDLRTRGRWKVLHTRVGASGRIVALDNFGSMREAAKFARRWMKEHPSGMRPNPDDPLTWDFPPRAFHQGWIRKIKIDVRSIPNPNEDREGFEREKERISKILLQDEEDPIIEVGEMIRDSTTAEEFDEAMEKLYNYADWARYWIA